jgi:hypothetical protein
MRYAAADDDENNSFVLYLTMQISQLTSSCFTRFSALLFGDRAGYDDDYR